MRRRRPGGDASVRGRSGRIPLDRRRAIWQTGVVVEGVLGAYRVVKKLGEGGMGAVYLAEHTLIGRRAAVKVLQPAMSANQDIVQRFFNEARAATAIADPGIVQIFDFGYHTDGSAYIVMEFLEGEALDSRLKRLGRLAPDDALRIVRQVASSLAAAHRAGIVHRDLKPENIFLVPDREVASGERAKILDFGIAKLTGNASLGGDSKLKTATAAIMGTPMYMSPEQCRGAGHVDARSDQYSLGCVLFHLLTGRMPFDGEGVGEIIAHHMMSTPPPPSTLAPGLSPALDALVLRLLAKRPEERFATASELADACGALLGTGMASGVGYAAPSGVGYAAAPSMPGAITGAPSLTTLSGAAGAGAIGTVAAPPRKRGTVIAIGAVAAVVVGVVAVVLMSGGGGEQPGAGVAAGPGTASAPREPAPPTPTAVAPPTPTAATPPTPPAAVTPPEAVPLPAAPIAVVFAIDNSGAMSGAEKHVLAAVDAAARALPPTAVVGLVRFDSTAAEVAPLAVLDRAALVEAVTTLRPGGGRDVLGGLARARDTLRRAPASATRHVLVIAGGDLARTNLDDTVAGLLADRVTVSTFGLDDTGRAGLEAFAEPTGGKSYARLKPSALGGALAKELRRVLGAEAVATERPEAGHSTGRTTSSGGAAGRTTPTPTTGPLDPSGPPSPPTKPSVPGDIDGDGIPDSR